MFKPHLVLKLILSWEGPLNIIRPLSVLAVLILLGEFITRVAIMSPNVAVLDAEIGWTWRPGEAMFQTKEGWSRNTINAIGFNDSELDELDDSSSRVLVIGDSFTEAMQVAQSRNFVSLLDDKKACHEFINAARSGIGFSHFPLVAEKFSALTPFDQIVLVINRWDLAESLNAASSYTRDEHGNITGVSNTFLKPHPIRQKLEPLFSNSAFAAFLMKRAKKMKDARNRKKFHAERATQSAEALEQRRLGKEAQFAELATFIIGEVKRYGPVSVVYLPDLDWGTSNDSVANQGAQAVPLAKEELASVQFYQLMERVLAKEDVPLISLKESFAQLYAETWVTPVGFANAKRNAGHLNELGHAAVAETLSTALTFDCVGVDQ